jgi:hypothetical protein
MVRKLGELPKFLVFNSGTIAWILGSGSSSGAPPKYRMVYTPPRGQLR